MNRIKAIACMVVFIPICIGLACLAGVVDDGGVSHAEVRCEIGGAVVGLCRGFSTGELVAHPLGRPLVEADELDLLVAVG